MLWRALAATTGDVVCYLDSDLVDFDPAFVPALLGPLLVEDGVHLVKGFYRRPLRLETAEVDTGGGRVTELLVRPLLAALRPELAGVVQPLGGEYAGTRELLESLPFAAGYGVEIGLLLDTHATRGLDAIAQVNLGVRKHRNRSLLQLGVMARQILAATLHHCGVPDAGAALTQFVQVGGEWLPSATPVAVGRAAADAGGAGPVARPAVIGTVGALMVGWGGGYRAALPPRRRDRRGGVLRRSRTGVRARRGARTARARRHPHPAALARHPRRGHP